MHYVGILEMDDAVSVGVCGAEVLNIDDFVTDGLLPAIGVGKIRKKLICYIVVLFGGGALIDIRIFVRQDVLSDAFVGDIA